MGMRREKWGIINRITIFTVQTRTLVSGRGCHQTGATGMNRAVPGKLVGLYNPRRGYNIKYAFKVNLLASGKGGWDSSTKQQKSGIKVHKKRGEPTGSNFVSVLAWSHQGFDWIIVYMCQKKKKMIWKRKLLFWQEENLVYINAPSF